MQKTGLQKQVIVIAAIALALAVCTLLYFFVIKPMSEENTEIPENTQSQVDRHGMKIINERPFIIDPFDYGQIERIDVENSYGGYCAYQKDGTLFLKGTEGFELDHEKVSALKVDTAYLYSVMEVEDVDFSDLSDYGFDNPTASFTVTKTDGSFYKIIVGEKIPTLGGYYVILEGRQALYVMGTEMEETVLASVEDFVTPTIMPSVPSSMYYSCKNFYFKKDGELFVELEMIEEKNVVTFGNQGTHKMIYPTAYTPSSTNISTVFQNFISFTGDKTVEIAPDEEALVYYGFLDAQGNNISDYEMYCKYDSVEAHIYFAAKDDTTYYAMSPSTNLIAEISAASLSFFEWELINWVNRGIFSMNINDVSQIKVSYDGVERNFEILGEDLNIRALCNGEELDIDNFKQYYMSLLYITIVGYEALPEGAQPTLVMTVVTDYGETIEYAFYDVSDRRTFFTINGIGEFYISRDSILKLKEDTQKVIAGETVVGNPNL